MILSHGFTRSRSTLGGHGAAIAEAGTLALAPDLPDTFDFRRNAQGLSELVARLRAGGPFGALGRDFAPGLRTEAILMRAPPSRCNAQAVAAPWGALLPGLRHDRVIEGASHGDFGSPTDWMCTLACGEADPQRQAAGRAGLLEAVARWLPPSNRTP